MEILDEAARLHLARCGNMKSQGGFEAVVREAATLRARKVIEHGEDRYERGQEKINLIETLTMIRKKGQRVNRVLEGIIEHGFEPDEAIQDPPPLDTLRDTMLDGANYNLMGVQLLDQLMGRAKEVEWAQPEKSKDFPWPFPIEQIAIQVANVDNTILCLKMLGLTEWSHDVVRASGTVNGAPAENVAHLAFNYQAGPFELELIQYTQGENWLGNVWRQSSGLSHLGIHVDDMDQAVRLIRQAGVDVNIVQEVITQSHSNEKVPAYRRYWYVILGTRRHMGFDLKLIQRLDIREAAGAPVLLTAQ